MISPYWTNGVATLYHADARDIPLPDGSVHCVITSPPYWGLRDYGLATWEGGDPNCDHARPDSHADREYAQVNPVPGGWRQNKGELPPQGVCGKCGAVQRAAGIGLEDTLWDWLDSIVAVGREVWRVLRDDGSWWLNLGDAYAGSGKGRNADGTHAVSMEGKQATHQGSINGVIPSRGAVNGIIPGKRIQRGEGSGRWGMGDTAVDFLAPKNVMGQPWRAAFALQDDGWILRRPIVWHKTNPMPESVTDRPTSSHEMIFLLTKQGRYYYDAEAVRQPHSPGTVARFGKNPAKSTRNKLGEPGIVRSNESFHNSTPNGLVGGANLRDVWSFPTQGRPEAHFATFPDELPRRCILAGTSEVGVCADCGAPWARVIEKSLIPTPAAHRSETTPKGEDGANVRGDGMAYSGFKPGYASASQTLGWEPTCDCGAGAVPATVLDPFVGSGTTLAVAQTLGRHAVGLDLNAEYLEIAKRRVGAVSLPLL